MGSLDRKSSPEEIAQVVGGWLAENWDSEKRCAKGAASYDENLLVCSDQCKALVSAYKNEFEYLFTNSNALALDIKDAQLLKPLAAPKKSAQAIFTSYNFSINRRGKKFSMRVESPDQLGEAESRLIKVIDKAKTSIQIATGHFRTWTLLQSLVRAKMRGVEVELLLDSQEYISAGYQRHENKKKKLHKSP